jgi:DNA-directed RNA polymerase specialized sigma24 family protein
MILAQSPSTLDALPAYTAAGGRIGESRGSGGVKRELRGGLEGSIQTGARKGSQWDGWVRCSFPSEVRKSTVRELMKDERTLLADWSTRHERSLKAKLFYSRDWSHVDQADLDDCFQEGLWQLCFQICSDHREWTNADFVKCFRKTVWFGMLSAWFARYAVCANVRTHARRWYIPLITPASGGSENHSHVDSDSSLDAVFVSDAARSSGPTTPDEAAMAMLVDGLDPRRQTVVEQYYVHECSTDEIAQELGIKRYQAKWLRTSAVRVLKERMFQARRGQDKFHGQTGIQKRNRVGHTAG